MNIKKNKILGSRRLSNYCWATITSLGGISFLLAGLSSYMNINLLPFSESRSIIFIPQGAVMMFYGSIAVSLSIFLWLTIIWNVGAGYNKFNQQDGLITIFRIGFPGKNRSFTLTYKIKDIQAIKINVKNG